MTRSATIARQDGLLQEYCNGNQQLVVPVLTGAYRNTATVISNLLEPVLTGDACININPNVMCRTNKSYLSAMLPFRFRASQLMFLGQAWGRPWFYPRIRSYACMIVVRSDGPKRA